MILIDMFEKRDVRVTTKHFTLENGILTLLIDVGDYPTDGKTVTAVFDPKVTEVGPLDVVEGVVHLPIYASMLEVGINYVQLNFRWDNRLEQSGILIWPVDRSLFTPAPDPADVDVLTGLISVVNDIIAVEEDRVAAEDLRVAAEQARETAEGLRKSAEIARENAESLRDAAYNQAETTRDNQYDVAEAARNGQYNNAEAARDALTGDLSGLTTTDKTSLVNAVNELDADKVDKAEGKGLSTEDYTTAEKAKVANIPEDTNAQLAETASKIVYDTGKNWLDESLVNTVGEYKYSPYVPVPENTEICISTAGVSYAYITSIKCFDSEQTLILSPTTTTVNIGSRSGKVFTTPTGCEFITFTWRTSYSGGVLAYDVMVTLLEDYAIYEPFKEWYGFSKTNYVTKDEFNPNTIFYVSPTGSDTTNDGLSPTSPFLTFKKAIDMGATEIYAYRGVYKQTLGVNGVNGLKILPYDNDEEYNASYPDRQLISISGGDELSALVDRGDGILTQTYSGGFYFNEVFITQTETPMNGTKPRAVVWQTHEDVSLDERLTPVLTIAEVESTQGTFTWDGTTIYINPLPTVYVSFNASIGNGVPVTINSCKNITLEDIKVTDAYYDGFVIKNCMNVKMQNCHSLRTNYYNGFSLDNSNVNLYKCTAIKSGNDGFNVHEYGETNFFDCNGLHCYDDGMSHHYGCVGSIFGGEYSFNGKGGILPAYGADVNIYNIKAEGNVFQGIGYLTYLASGHADRKGYVNGNLLLNNGIGLSVGSTCTVTAVNNVFKGNTVDKDNQGVLEEYNSVYLV